MTGAGTLYVGLVMNMSIWNAYDSVLQLNIKENQECA